jgi:2-oxoglutarate ferredoxin oxidoreductase subunit gamma
VQLIASREPVLYPYITSPDILVAMSQEAYTRFVPRMRPGGLLILEEDLVQPGSESEILGAHVFQLPATRLAEELGRKMVLNMVLVGFFSAVTGLLSQHSARRAVSESVPRGTEALNLAAFEKGYACGASQMAVAH